jgi:orotidine-5'-phosphate decarboxylase
MTNFSERFISLAKERTPFCLGIDPTPELLKAWDLSDTAEGLKQMCEIIVEAIPLLAVVKPQIAYFERFGVEGIKILIWLIEQFHNKDILVIVDAKRGDIGTTVKAYAQSILGAESALKADAVTAHAYLGFESLTPLLEHAQKTGTGVFVVVKSSNPEGKLIQNAVVQDGRTVAEYLADKITTFNEKINNAEIGSIGAVIGVSTEDSDLSVIQRLGKSLILAPGIGYQGASFENLQQSFGKELSRVIPTSSRAVLSSGPNPKNLNLQIKKWVDQTRLLSTRIDLC